MLSTFTPSVGTRQETFTTARVNGGVIEPLETIDGGDEGGDATVPRLSAIPKTTRPDSPLIRWVSDQHGALQSNRSVLDEIEGILTARPVIHRVSRGIELSARIESLVLAGEMVSIEAAVIGEARVALQTLVTDEQGKQVATALLRMTDGVHKVTLDPLRPGAYRLTVGGIGAMSTRVAPVTCSVLVWEDEGT